MLSGPSEPAIKDKSALNAFVERASGRLASIRNGILIFDQDRSADGDIDVSIRNLQLLRRESAETDCVEIVELIDQCSSSLQLLLGVEHSPAHIGRSLDTIARIEELLLKIPLASDDFLPDVSDFIDSSFESLWGSAERESAAAIDVEGDEDFEVDEETLEIFRSEAGDLIRNITSGLDRLNASTDDREALWEIRRAAHTFKGAAGIVGIKAASEMAHRLEDLLDKLVETHSSVDTPILDLIGRSARQLDRSIYGVGFDEHDLPRTIYAEFDRVIDAVANEKKATETTEQKTVQRNSSSPSPYKTKPDPIVRVSLDRLDEIIGISRDLANNRSALVEDLSRLADNVGITSFSAVFESLSTLFEAQRVLNNELQEKLFRIRLVRFGTLETRLSRAVHVTCQEENKKAAILIENGDCEIDTQIIDAMIEPLLHLLKNAVVHGIELEDRRRLIGKPERGTIRICIHSASDGVTLIVEDDGRGISANKLKEKAVQNGIISQADADQMDDASAFGLMFNRGLTTADKLNLNAGRGIGMSIVKESVENCGGSVAVISEPQVGTQFTIRMPLTLPKPETVSEANTKATSTNQDASKKTVLVIDDSVSVRRQTCKLIEDAGHKVITAENGAEALELLLSDVWRPDLIISDVEMPIMDGWEFLEFLKADEVFGNIPVIMLTSLDGSEHRARAERLGAADYHLKPAGRGSLITAVSGHLNKSIDQ